MCRCPAPALLCAGQILEIKTESQELIAALSTLSSIYPDNTPAARRHLRSTIEERGLGINEQFLAAAEGVTKVQAEVLLLLLLASTLMQLLHMAAALLLASHTEGDRLSARAIMGTAEELT